MTTFADLARRLAGPELDAAIGEAGFDTASNDISGWVSALARVALPASHAASRGAKNAHVAKQGGARQRPLRFSFMRQRRRMLGTIVALLVVGSILVAVVVRNDGEPNGVTGAAATTPTDLLAQGEDGSPSTPRTSAALAATSTTTTTTTSTTSTTISTTTAAPTTVLPQTTLAPPAPTTTERQTTYNQQPCWKYDADFYADDEAQGLFVAPIGTPITASTEHLDWYTGVATVIKVNSDCSEVAVATSHPGDELSFTSFVGQQWVAVLAEDHVVDGAVLARRGDQLWNELAGRETGSWGEQPDGYDPWPIPPCC